MPRIRNGSGKDFTTKDKENYATILCVLGPGTKSLCDVTSMTRDPLVM